MINNPVPPTPHPTAVTSEPNVTRALVLGGGSLKGAFQAGAVMALFESGFVPDQLYGISVGSLNATFIANEAARQHAETGTINWEKVGKYLIEFWIRNITKPDDVAVIRSRFRLGYNTLIRRFDGLLDNSPIKNLIRNHVDMEAIKNGPVKIKVGAVDIIEGDMRYADAQDPNFLDYVYASSSLPFLMPAVQIGGDHRRAFLDGGLREVAPLRVAIEDGATDIACAACHARKIYNEKFNYRNILNLMDRVKDITVNQLVNNDIAWAERYAEREHLHGRNLNLTIIRPTEPLFFNLMKFTSDDIGRMIVSGYQAGTDVLKPKNSQ
ncbi:MULTISPECIES: patatin-like phospholipase family protein [Spirosoma]|uniref:Patatin-like phospholipase family protein n=1 Tax=Spirosoma liriopis TaxID=2937440 RepID=A0ABT0HH65_9BACT|nr:MULTISPECIES: patatin-like phospholipase family protein [Spirosoma]MCK8491018.1 patatin-like phospholipase family protein [Spirosoma liriopis]UHG90402.1 patatin-like phospholipase family protein [Spirosoma oryzicola]